MIFLSCCPSLNSKRSTKGDPLNKLQDVTYCGLYCRLCSTKFRVPETASALRDTLASDGWQDFVEQIMPDFKAFWAVLNRFSDFDKTCPSCREGCGDPGCKIRKCAKKRNVDICPDCEEYPCEHIHALAQRYPNLVPDGFRLKKNWCRNMDRRTGKKDVKQDFVTVISAFP